MHIHTSRANAHKQLGKTGISFLILPIHSNVVIAEAKLM